MLPKNHAQQPKKSRRPHSAAAPRPGRSMSDTPLSFDVVEIIDYVKKSKLRTMTHDETQETLGHIHTHLCRMLSSMLNSPLTGRMFIPMQHAQAQDAAKLASLTRQLL